MVIVYGPFSLSGPGRVGIAYTLAQSAVGTHMLATARHPIDAGHRYSDDLPEDAVIQCIRLDALLERDSVVTSIPILTVSRSLSLHVRKTTLSASVNSAPRGAMSPGTSTAGASDTPSHLLDVGHSVTNAMWKAASTLKSNF